MKKSIIQSVTVVLVGIIACFILCGVAATPAHAAANLLPPNATKVVKHKDGNYYALYKGKVCALTQLKAHAKNVTVPKSIKVKGKRYKVVAIHDLGLDCRKDVKRITIKATDLETVEDPVLFKSWRQSHNYKINVKITNKEIKKWLNAKW